jgi:hypothetical protein
MTVLVRDAVQITLPNNRNQGNDDDTADHFQSTLLKRC